ncbi:hypothetical protein JXJ21_15165 [candidate division KSB1 bacterium]|nr:hypothetical protein [candidate division KSB1 bacterium]
MKTNKYLAIIVAAVFAMVAFVSADSFAAPQKVNKSLSKVNDGYFDQGTTVVKFAKKSGETPSPKPNGRYHNKLDAQDGTSNLWTRIIRLVQPDKTYDKSQPPYQAFTAPKDK